MGKYDLTDLAIMGSFLSHIEGDKISGKSSEEIIKWLYSKKEMYQRQLDPNRNMLAMQMFLDSCIEILK